MANKIVVTESKLSAIGDSIREKTGEDGGYTLDQIPGAIRSISTGIDLSDEELFKRLQGLCNCNTVYERDEVGHIVHITSSDLDNTISYDATFGKNDEGNYVLVETISDGTVTFISTTIDDGENCNQTITKEES